MHNRFLLWVSHKCVSRNSGLWIGYAFLHWMEQQEPRSVCTRTNWLQIKLIVRHEIALYNAVLENEQVLMEANMARTEIAPELLETVAGGALGFDPDAAGTYTMHCEFSGQTFTGVALGNIMQIAQFGASIPNTPEGEQQIIAWAKARNYI